MRSHCGKLLLTLPAEGLRKVAKQAGMRCGDKAVESIKLVELTPAKIQHWKLC